MQLINYTKSHLTRQTQDVISVPPPSCTEHRHPQNGLLAVNGLAIVNYRKHSLTLSLGSGKTFRWVFIVANVQTPSLGADFHSPYSLSFHSHLVDDVTQLRI